MRARAFWGDSLDESNAFCTQDDVERPRPSVATFKKFVSIRQLFDIAYSSSFRLPPASDVRGGERGEERWADGRKEEKMEREGETMQDSSSPLSLGM